MKAVWTLLNIVKVLLGISVAVAVSIFGTIGLSRCESGATTGGPGINPPKLRDFSSFSESFSCAVLDLVFGASNDFLDVGKCFWQSDQAGRAAAC